jgi:hypothetical protein
MLGLMSAALPSLASQGERISLIEYPGGGIEDWPSLQGMKWLT